MQTMSDITFDEYLNRAAYAATYFYNSVPAAYMDLLYEHRPDLYNKIKLDGFPIDIHGMISQIGELW